MDNSQRKQSTGQRVAVLISDIHFDLNTLAPASAALTQAVNKANELDIRLVVAGDIHNSKANIRGECIKAILDILDECNKKPIVIVANHDLINEKGSAHSLEFLRNTTTLIEKPTHVEELNSWCIPYHSNPDELRKTLSSIRDGSRIIMHQGLQGSDSGEYIQDKSALNYEDVKDFRVISGHYHKRQDIKTGRPQKGAVGLFSYIGNPFTLGFGEANDPPKGYQILMDDGTLEFVSTNLRRHVIYNIDFSKLYTYPGVGIALQNDLLWIKLNGTKEQLSTVTKQSVHNIIKGPESFRLDLIPTDSTPDTTNAKQLKDGELLDFMIDSMPNLSDERKTALKELWRGSASN